MLLRESLGISADGSEKAFSAKDIESMIARLENKHDMQLRPRYAQRLANVDV